MRYQPQLFEVPQDTGFLKEGDILCAGSSIPDNMQKTQLQLYRSADKGCTWSFLSVIDTGGAAMVDLEDKDAQRPIWEPYLYLSRDGDLVVYYSDERFMKSRKYNQLLCHKVSKDGGITWEEEVFDVAIPDGNLRPGMPIVVRLPNDKYIMIYEIVNIPDYPVYCRFSDDALNWGDPEDLGTLVADKDGNFLTNTPYVIWTSKGGSNGTIIVSGKRPGSGDALLDPGYFLVNTNLGQGPWEQLPTLNPYDSHYHCCGYSQTMIAIQNGTKLLQLSPVQIYPGMAQIACAVADIVPKDQ